MLCSILLLLSAKLQQQAEKDKGDRVGLTSELKGSLLLVKKSQKAISNPISGRHIFIHNKEKCPI